MGNEKGEGAWEEPKGKSRRVKRRQVQTSDGWTVVTHTTSGRADQHEQILEGERPRTLVPGLTIERLGLEFKELERRFRDTTCARQLGGMLKSRVMIGEGQEVGNGVDTAVCIGIGSFSVDWEHRWRAMWQLVLFLFVVKESPTIGEHEIQMVAQEPLFTSLDISFLSSFNITVLTSAIETHISATTFVFAPFVDWHILLPVFLQSKDPTLYVGNELLDDYSTYASSPEKARLLEDCNTIGRELLKGREMIKVPELECHAHALNGLAVYWRKEKG
ncbi:hypothetical protein K491DRAFT_589277 [Lophiostoma macrostomum CBS 122681]|uniref:SRR1-like domain-containing protein n=1 Tax=Lophiostoma macrostomum CBS 122681 TaxID=1314788 RepID=A0A6A6TMX8_9PLEO|nr:hypothetical protein K491DRAFT_589277 [Lophiostoma macrostomum CBS 122681]